MLPETNAAARDPFSPLPGSDGPISLAGPPREACMPVIALIVLLVTFLATLVARRAQGWYALAIGSLPALLVAAANPSGLGEPLMWLYIAGILLPFLVAAFAGAALARLARSYRPSGG
jgi:hypothetical protein